MSEEQIEQTESSSPLCSLDCACRIVLGGVMAISPELYGQSLDKIAEMTGRVNDQQFRSDVIGVLKAFTHSMD